jgi:multiple sugar transport system substrate-binding protein
MKKRSVTLAAGLAASILAITACTSGGGDEPSSDEPVDITYTTWASSETVHAAYTALADEFRETHPELGEFTIEVIPIEDYTSQLTLRLNSGDAPDLSAMLTDWMPAWIDAGAFHDISALKDDPEWDFDDIIPGLLQRMEGENGELYGYPNNNGTHPVIYNKTLFETAGIPTPRELHAEGEWTWQKLREISKQLVDAGLVTYGFDIPQFNFQNYGQLNAYVLGFGGDPWPGGETCGLADPETVEAYEFIHDLMFTDNTIPKPGNVSSFPTGDTAMYLGPTSTLGDLADATFEYDMAPQPAGEGVPYGPTNAQSVLVAWEGGEDPELATELLAYMTTAEAAASFTNIPPRASVLTEEFVADLYPGIEPSAAKVAMLDTLPDAVTTTVPVSYPEITVAITPILDGLWTPDADVEAVLAEACEAAAPYLEE